MRAQIATALALIVIAGSANAAERTRFWNLTSNTIEQLYLSAPGQNKYGEDLCKLDDDGSVDHDERLTLKGVSTGHYDVKFVDAKGRTCVVPNVAITAGKVFTIDEKELKDCTKAQ
ncbi:hypothetical protein [Segnochrobactrum spirostomi]|uniref:Uncharacterized protein n=1 Tax=Segnochrobactrum spirostomi TaxID=2608987 RepID=A0A6A7Y058_9HYPH|nr:hypothetical protein [Segnochrobactrum spirostomi]MQT11389.1 hypothetical protein [Segnochrobactrum spirostomi]